MSAPLVIRSKDDLPDLAWVEMRRRPTLQRVTFAPERGVVMSPEYGVLGLRTADALMEGVSGALHPLTTEDLAVAYMPEPPEGQPGDLLVYLAADAQFVRRIRWEVWRDVISPLLETIK